MQPAIFDETARQRLMTLLDEKSSNGNTMRCDEVQGFMTALITGPDALDDSEWLPEILGHEDYFSEDEREEVKQLVSALAQDLRRQLEAKTFTGFWECYATEEGTDYYPWCNAYLYALDVVHTDWFEAVDQEEFEELFYPLMALGGMFDDEENGGIALELDDQEIQELAADLPVAVQDIYRYWQAIIRKPQTVRRNGQKIGRNDPCPCGSGKKYKACCDRNG